MKENECIGYVCSQSGSFFCKVCQAEENRRSEGADVAGMHRYFLASALRRGYCCSLSVYHCRGLMNLTCGSRKRQHNRQIVLWCKAITVIISPLQITFTVISITFTVISQIWVTFTKRARAGAGGVFSRPGGGGFLKSRPDLYTTLTWFLRPLIFSARWEIVLAKKRKE